MLQGFHSQGLWIPVCIQGTQSHWGWHSFVESHLGSEGKSCASKATVLGLRTCTYKQNKKPLHEDYLAKFWYPCQTAENNYKEDQSYEVSWSVCLVCDIVISLWHQPMAKYYFDTFWRCLPSENDCKIISRFLSIMLTKAWLIQRLLEKTREISHKVTQNRIEDRVALLCSHSCSAYCHLCIWNCLSNTLGARDVFLIADGPRRSMHGLFFNPRNLTIFWVISTKRSCDIVFMKMNDSPSKND